MYLNDLKRAETAERGYGAGKHFRPHSTPEKPHTTVRSHVSTAPVYMLLVTDSHGRVQIFK